MQNAKKVELTSSLTRCRELVLVVDELFEEGKMFRNVLVYPFLKRGPGRKVVTSVDRILGMTGD